MADNVIEFPILSRPSDDPPLPLAKDGAPVPLPKVRCSDCGSTEWHLVLPHPELRRGKMACAGCGGQFGMWMEMIAEFGIE